MFASEAAKAVLQTIPWEDGKIVPIVEGPYRYRIVVHCSPHGRQRAHFVNGEYPYFAYIEIVSGGGQWSGKGAQIVPVLPDAKLLMVIEQRPAQGRFPGCPTIAKIAGKRVDLSRFGPFSSLEFPGGGIEKGEGLKAGFLRELVEETGVGEQNARCYSRRWPTFSFGSDIASQQFLHVVFLSWLSFTPHAETDGGLAVFALTPDEVQYNIWNGVIQSAQAGLNPWNFYREVMEILNNPNLGEKLMEVGYLTFENVKILKPIS